MARGNSTGANAREQAQNAARKARPWIEGYARFGHAAYGVVYALVGSLAVQAALGSGEAAGQQGALRAIMLAPLGKVILCLVAFGLLGYAMWRLFQGVLDPDNEGRDVKGFGKRFNHVLNGLFHAFLAFTAVQLALLGSSGGGGSPEDLTARLLQEPFGRLLTAGVGVGIVCAGLYQFYFAYRAKFMEELEPGRMGTGTRKWTRRSGRFGYAARGVVFIVIGVFLVQAALQTDPNEARGLGGALTTLARQPFGPYLLGVVALGLVSYGAFMFVVARYRRIDPA
ncbi:MAG TPA: DUF1206 domain-containing protein [Rubrobacter sp.]|nr:DUF1206 domain-containing protein [Rubrobacter sp.]